MKYLRKRNVYRMAVQLLPEYDLPMCMDCTYKAHGGYEWLSFCSGFGLATFTVAFGGKWVRVCERNNDSGKVVHDKLLSAAEFVRG